MIGLEDGVSAATAELSEIEKARESSMEHSRRVIRLTKRVIHAIHNDEPYLDQVDAMTAEMDAVLSFCSSPSVLSSGPVQDAMGEYAEAMIFDAAITGKCIPSHSDLRIPAGPWVLGLADSEGELRRMVMTHLVDGDLDGAKSVFSMMEGIHQQIMLIDVPDAVVPIRRKQDIARGIMDRTRSDITLASIMRRD